MKQKKIYQAGDFIPKDDLPDARLYYFVVRIIRKMPYFIREFFWVQLYYYNRAKGPGNFTLEDYIGYARNWT